MMSLRLVLKSIHSTLFHPNNQPHSFRVHLPRPLNLQGVWTVSLLEFSHAPGKSKQQGFPEVFVCSNICEDTIVGDMELPLLRRIYLNKENIIYQSPSEVPIKVGQFQDVHVYIRDAKNSPASVLSGEVTVTLLLRKLPFFNDVRLNVCFGPDYVATVL